MKKFWSGVLAASVAATVGVAAQEAPPAPSPSAPAGVSAPAPQDVGGERQLPPATQQAAAGTVMISGCIQKGPATASAGATVSPPSAPGAAGAPSASASASAQEQFILADAKMAGAAGAGGAVGTTGTAATRYELDGDASELSKHVNHQVEITGMVQSSSASPTGAAGAAAGSTAAAPKLKVTAIKMVAAKCE